MTTREPLRLSLVLPVVPRTKKNSRRHFKVNGRTVPVPSHAYAQMEEAICTYVALVAPGARLGIAHPVNCRAVFYRQHRRGDLVGYCQALCDALQKAGVLADDKFVQGFDGTRLALDRECPRIVVTLETLAMEEAA